MALKTSNVRAGAYVTQPTKYRAFIPAPLPPDPPLAVAGKLLHLLSDSDRAIGRLDAAADVLPNPDLSVAMYVRREAVESSQIEGTQASLADLLEYEVAARATGRPSLRTTDVGEVVNYVAAMNYGLERLVAMPLSLRLIREIHAKLLTGTRGERLEPGEFRRSQNWIGPPGCTLDEAAFVPPPPHELPDAMGKLESFLHDDSPVPPLVRCGLAHAQFETIHPFLDGNGRVGRLLITFWLCWKGILRRPLLYLSHHFKRHRDEYYRRLQRVRDHGDWEGWMSFFLEGVRAVAIEAGDTARRIQEMREEHRSVIVRRVRTTANALRLLDHLFISPMVSVNNVKQLIDRTYPVARELIAEFERLRLLFEVTGQERNRVFAYEPYLQLFGESAMKKRM